MFALLVLGSLSDLLDTMFGRFHYLAPFTVLLLCGVGFPLPEEVTLIASGLLLHQGDVRFVPITVVCSSAILLGDSIPYWLGRYYGIAALRSRWAAKVLHPERFATLEKRFRDHGNWAIFTCRFLPGLRIPGYFLAGSLKMSYARFMLLDGLGVLLSVPISIYLGKLFGAKVEELQKNMRHLHLWLALGLVSVLLILYVRARIRRRERAEPAPPTSGTPIGGVMISAPESAATGVVPVGTTLESVAPGPVEPGARG
ncbi:MAG: DedA family protein [Planctomycetota bacterium]